MAAPTLVLTSATPYALKYLFTDDSTGGGATKTLAALIADAKTAGPGPSPLVAFLSGVTDVTWPLSDEGGDLTIYTGVRADAASGLTVSAIPQNTAPATNSLLVTAKTGTALTAVVEIRFHNTFER